MEQNATRRDILGLAAAAVVAGAGEALRGEESTGNGGGGPMLEEKVIQAMAKLAREISQKAYAPYSRFPVGAVVLTNDGKYFTGCNVENASYGLTICAERNAVFQMVSGGARKIAAVMIYTPTAMPTAPCGACRQVLNEFGPDAVVLSVCDGTETLRKKLSDLLPDAFGPANLESSPVRND
jgi:cytidine deaminase